MKSLFVLFSLPFLLTQCMVVNTNYLHGDGISVRETRRLDAFTRVDLVCPVHVTIQTGSEYAAYVTSDANLSSYFRTDAFAGVLTIGLEGDIEPVVIPEILLVVPDIRKVVHSGGGTVEILEGGDFPNLDLQLNGPGEMYFSGTAHHLDVNLSGSGAIYLEGFASHLTVNLIGSGEVHADNLLAEDADVDLRGSGSVYLDLDYESTLNVDISGSGMVEWWGAPRTLNYNLFGMGEVIEHRGLPKKSAGMSGLGVAKRTSVASNLYTTVAKLPRKTLSYP